MKLNFNRLCPLLRNAGYYFMSIQHRAEYIKRLYYTYVTMYVYQDFSDTFFFLFVLFLWLTALPKSSSRTQRVKVIYVRTVTPSLKVTYLICISRINFFRAEWKRSSLYSASTSRIWNYFGTNFYMLNGNELLPFKIIIVYINKTKSIVYRGKKRGHTLPKGNSLYRVDWSS